MQRDLVIRAQGGDHEAFSALATAAIGGLHTTARLILRDVERADDAVQDALMAAWLDIRGVRDPDRFDAWLHRLLVRACYKVARSHHRRQLSEVPLLPVDAPMAPDGAGSLALRDQLERGFRRLSPEQRAVLVLPVGVSPEEPPEVSYPTLGLDFEWMGVPHVSWQAVPR